MRSTNTLFIDTEFNGYNGELLSMALVDVEDNEFYEVIATDTPLDEWVRENVVPVFKQTPISYREFQKKLSIFLSHYSDFYIVADWPDDISYFCKALVAAPGVLIMEAPNFTITVKPELGNYVSDLPHNALENAKAIQKKWGELRKQLFLFPQNME